MSVKSAIKGDTLSINIQGKFDFSIHQEFRATYKDIDRSSIKNVLVDLYHVEYMDSAALGMLLLLNEYFPGKRIQLINANTVIRQILEIANFHKKFDIR